MTANERAEELLALLREKLPGAEFRRAYGKAAAGRRLQRPLVTVGIAAETAKRDSGEVKYECCIYLPPESGGDEGEGLFAELAEALREAYPQCAAISRGGFSTDRETGLLFLPCTAVFPNGGDPAQQEIPVRLGDMERTAAGIRTSLARRTEGITSIGESAPFAVLSDRTEYTVELSGLDCGGLEGLSGFLAEVGGASPAVYRNCQWKSLAPIDRKAVFVSGIRG